jgi:hypothetical protein
MTRLDSLRAQVEYLLMSVKTSGSMDHYGHTTIDQG